MGFLRSLWQLFFLLALLGVTFACAPLAGPRSLEVAEEPPRAQEDTRLDWWREARFGLFVHWGLYAVPAGEWGGGTGYGEWIRTSARIPLEVYDGFLSGFNPVEFDADAWARAAKGAGMKYVVITTKHHDGFALYDSKVSDFDVMATPFGRDIMKELAEACRREGLAICWYHSIMDWHHPDYLPRRDWETSRSSEGAVFERFVTYLRGQVSELLTNYGPIGVMWFDGQWESTWNHSHGQALYDLCRELQPSVIVNNRVDTGRAVHGLTDGPRFAGDFGTPEQEIPPTGVPGLDWETCMTMNRHWGFNRADHDYKSTTELVRNLCDIASKGGNFLLNVGPTPEGTFPEESLTRLAEIGQWMAVNGRAIHGTSASPFGALPYGRCTLRREGGESRVFLLVFDWPSDGRLALQNLGNEGIEARLLADPLRALVVERQGDAVWVSNLPAAAPDAHASVIELLMPGAPIVYGAPRLVSASSLFVARMKVELEAASPLLELRYSLDGSLPGNDGRLYGGPFEVESSATLSVQSFHHGRAVGPLLVESLTKVEPWPAAEVQELLPGLQLSVYAGNWDSLPAFAALVPTERAVVAAIAPPTGALAEHQGRVYEGVFEVPRTGLWRWSLTSDDGARLLIDGRSAVDHDGLHGASTLTGDVPLAAGPHRILVEWFNKTGGAEIQVGAREVATGEELLPRYFHEKD